jgi:hypothetical protein
MKILALIMLLVLLPISTASTYTLGSHQVSFNVNETYNYTAKINPPMHSANSNDWLYTLDLTNDTPGIVTISVDELSFADYGRKWTTTYAEIRAQSIKDNGIGGYKSSTMDFKGYPAYQGSYPAQSVWLNGDFIDYSACQELAYQIDERTIAGVRSIGDNVPYQEVLDSIEVIEAPKKPTKYAPYIISNKAGNGSKA